MIGTLPAKPKTWTTRHSDEVALQVWRVIANAGPRGIGASNACDRLNGMDSELLKAHLRGLQRNGHVRFIGTNRWGAWVATGVLPKDEPGPTWLLNIDPEPGDDEPRTPQQSASKADQVLAAARWVPNSAFALGAQAAGFGVDIDAAHMPAEHKAAMAAPLDPSLETVVSFEFPNKPLAETEATPAAEVVADLVAEAPPPSAQVRESLNAGTCAPWFSFCSDNTLTIALRDGRFVILAEDETRQLFRYLDRLMAIGHGSLSEATS